MTDAASSSDVPVAVRPESLAGRVVSHPAFWVAVVLLSFSWPIAKTVRLGTSPDLAVLGTVPEFQLTDQSGRSFGSANLRGRIWVADFVFTRCPTICPTLTRRMAELQARTLRLGGAFHLVSFSVDPEHDTPDVLAEYAASYGAHGHRWAFLTGPLDSVRPTVVDGFRIAMEQEGEVRTPESIIHGNHFVLVDASMRIRGYYDTEDEEAWARLIRDVTWLVNGGA